MPTASPSWEATPEIAWVEAQSVTVLLVLPLGHLAVGLEGTVGDLRGVVAALASGAPPKPSRVPGSPVVSAWAGCASGGLVHGALVHEVRQHLVLDLHRGRAVARHFFRSGRHRRDLVVGPTGSRFPRPG